MRLIPVSYAVASDVRPQVTALLSPRGKVNIDARTNVLRGSRWQVYDVLIDGASFVSTYRSQFDRVIQAESYGALVERLRKRSLDTAVVDRKKL